MLTFEDPDHLQCHSLPDCLPDQIKHSLMSQEITGNTGFHFLFMLGHTSQEELQHKIFESVCGCIYRDLSEILKTSNHLFRWVCETGIVDRRNRRKPEAKQHINYEAPLGWCSHVGMRLSFHTIRWKTLDWWHVIFFFQGGRCGFVLMVVRLTQWNTTSCFALIPVVIAIV